MLAIMLGLGCCNFGSASYNDNASSDRFVNVEYKNVIELIWKDIQEVKDYHLELRKVNNMNDDFHIYEETLNRLPNDVYTKSACGFFFCDDISQFFDQVRL
jgi:hypothetical protein